MDRNLITSKELLEIIKRDFTILNDRDNLITLFNIPNNESFLIENFEEILNTLNDIDDFVFLYVKNFINNKEILSKLAYHPNIKIRMYFMNSLGEINSRLLSSYYPNITKYLTNKKDNQITEIMPETFVSELTVKLIDYEYDEKLFNELMNFIFKNYKYNHLLYYLDRFKQSMDDEDDFFHVKDIITKNANKLFKTSIDYKLDFVLEYRDLVSESTFNKYKRLLGPLMSRTDEIIRDLFYHELGNEFMEYIEKYLKLSNNKTLKLLDYGSTCHTYQIGDYVIKYISSVYSILGAKNKCPNIFLANKVIEETIKYDDHNRFLGMLEVQKLLTNPLTEDQTDIYDLITNELKNLGYYCDDYLVGSGRQNVFMLDDYHDADTSDPENLPEWFKKTPYVLVDRDCIYPIEYKDEITQFNMQHNISKEKLAKKILKK